MGECYITRRGGAGGGKAFAVIGVTYPAGSVCTCTDGSKKLKLKDTSGQGFFLIPYAAAWTVTATDGTNTKAQSVEITSKGQSESVELSYNIWLIHNGAVQSNTFSVFNGTPKTFAKVGSVFRVAVSTNTISAYFDNKIDCSKISSIKIVLAGGKTAYNLTFGLISAKTAFNPVTADDSNKNIFPIASAVVPAGTFSKTTKTIDVSGNSGSYYLGCTLDYTNGMNDATYGNGGFDITDIELIEVK